MYSFYTAYMPLAIDLCLTESVMSLGMIFSSSIYLPEKFVISFFITNELHSAVCMVAHSQYPLIS